MYPVDEIDAQTLKQWIDEGRRVRILDVRSPTETARGVIEGSELLPLHLVPIELNRLLTGSEEEPLVIVCRSGARSYQACAFLNQHGARHTYNLRGGLIGWVGAGYPLVLPGASATTAA
jgi:rhodanese-related sulfurtransferase